MIELMDVVYAQKLRHLRYTKKYKQEAVAKLLGIKRQQEYSNLENGKLAFTDELIAKICTVFSTTPDEFVKPMQGVHITESPNSNNNNSPINSIDLVNELIKTKDDIIKLQIELLKVKDDLIQSLKDK